MPVKKIGTKFSMLACLLFILLACNQTTRQSNNLKKTDTIKRLPDSGKTVHTSISKTDIEEKIIDTILKLTEVKEYAEWIENETKGMSHLKIWVEDTPNLHNRKYYWIKVGQYIGTTLGSYLDFYVYPNSMQIMYYNTLTNNKLTLNKWRKLNGMQQ